MTALFILIGISLLVAIGFLFAFIVSVNSGQFEDDYTPSVRILLDDYTPTKEKPNTNNNNRSTCQLKNLRTTTEL